VELEGYKKGMTLEYQDIFNALKREKNIEKAEVSSRFFKTGKGEYGEGDVFWGISVPTQRGIAQKYSDAPFSVIEKMLRDPVHEFRLTALLILVYAYKKALLPQRKKIFDFYIRHTDFINNWDLVDSSARDIVGAFLYESGADRALLYKLARSTSLWERRISIIATWFFIQKGDYKDTCAIATLHLTDSHDLMHKATGWMLREMGKKSEKHLVDFLKKNYKRMPRTMLRYALEKFPQEMRKAYLAGRV
jgi:3-methyladenine DNA glycosylase AlkD